jgi:hypothetical protein
VVTWNNEDRHTPIGNSPERLERLMCDADWNTRPIKHVAAMHDDIDLAGQRRR